MGPGVRRDDEEFVAGALDSIFKPPKRIQLHSRHCEPTGRANARPMTGSAKQSIKPQRKYGSLRRFAPRNDGPDYKRAFAISRREAPESLMKLSPQKKEGVGNAGCPLHPRPRVHFVLVERTRVTTSTPESPGIPARNGFNGFLRALPGDRALLPPSSADLVLSAPGRADLTSANLTPASGRQDHTTSPSAATSFVSSPFDRSQVFRPALHHVARLTLPRPPHPSPRS
jgi:hypothetical protein